MSKMKSCPVCGKEMAANAKACPSCGAKSKKALYKKWWFWVLAVLVIAVAGSAAGGGKEGGGSQQAAPQSGPTQRDNTPETDANQPEEPEIVYTAYTVGQLMEDLNSNALRAKSAYQDQYVELTGKLNVIDNDGKYISVVSADDNFAIIGVHCTIRGEEQLNRVLEMNVGDHITVRGQITDVGEIVGYYLDIVDFGE